MKQHLVIGLVLTTLGGLGVLWQVGQADGDEPAGGGRSSGTAPALVCPLGGHQL